MAGAVSRYLLEALECEGLLRAFLFRYAHNVADVDELLKETYARLLSAQGESSAEIRSVRAFALTVARNVALDWLRHRDVVPINLVADIAALDVLDESAQVEEIVTAHRELAQLPTRSSRRGCWQIRAIVPRVSVRRRPGPGPSAWCGCARTAMPSSRICWRRPASAEERGLRLLHGCAATARLQGRSRRPGRAC